MILKSDCNEIGSSSFAMEETLTGPLSLWLWYVQTAAATENSQLQKLAILEEEKMISEFARNHLELLIHWLDLMISNKEYNRIILFCTYVVVVMEITFPNWFVQAGWQVKYKAGHSTTPTFCQQPPYIWNKGTSSLLQSCVHFALRVPGLEDRVAQKIPPMTIPLSASRSWSQ